MKKPRLLQSFQYALRGIFHVLSQELSFRVQVFAALVVIAFMLVFPLASWERVILSLLIAGVLILEIMNTIVERIVDTFKPRIHPVVGEIKDMMAAAVLIVSLVAAIIGILIFWPYVWEVVKR